MKKKFTQRGKCVLILAALFSPALHGQSRQSVDVNRIDSLLNAAMELNLYSGNVLVVHNRAIVYERSFGMADYDHNIPNSPETEFQLASITKDFTRVMILQLAEQKNISLHDPVNKYLDGFSASAGKITIEQLMYFSSGLGDYHESDEFQHMTKANITIADILPIIRKEALKFEPGTRVLYSNSGYVVLGAILEKATGKNYYENLKNRILDKLAMSHTGMNGYIPPLPGIAVGYLSNEIGPLHNNSGWPLVGGGDGGIYTTTHDMLSFISSLFYDNRLLTDSSKLKFVSGPMSPEKCSDWSEFVKAGRYSPAGGAPGVSSLFTVNMKSQNISILLSNFDEGTAEEVGMRISAILNERPVPPLHPPASKYLYRVIEEKGGKYFEENFRNEMQLSGMREDDDMVLWQVGRELLNKHETDNALALYKVYTTLFPKILAGWNGYANAYLQKGDQQNARSCYEEILKLRPGNEEAKAALEKLK